MRNTYQQTGSKQFHEADSPNPNLSSCALDKETRRWSKIRLILADSRNAWVRSFPKKVWVAGRKWNYDNDERDIACSGEY